MKTFALLFGSVFLVGACSSLPEVPREVRIPVPIKCIEVSPERPSLLSDEELLALDDYGLVLGLARDRRIRQGYEAQLEAALEGCK